MKSAAISPDIFRGFAKELLSQHRKGEVGEIDESDPMSPYRDSDREKALNRPTEQTPRRDFARASWSNEGMSQGSSKLSGASSFGLYRSARAHQKKHEKDREELIPGSGYLAEGGIPYKRD